MGESQRRVEKLIKRGSAHGTEPHLASSSLGISLNSPLQAACRLRVTASTLKYGIVIVNVCINSAHTESSSANFHVGVALEGWQLHIVRTRISNSQAGVRSGASAVTVNQRRVHEISKSGTQRHLKVVSEAELRGKHNYKLLLWIAPEERASSASPAKRAFRRHVPPEIRAEDDRHAQAESRARLADLRVAAQGHGRGLGAHVHYTVRGNGEE